MLKDKIKCFIHFIFTFRGQNLISCWAMREIEAVPDACIFEFALCVDLKGSIPKYVLNNVSIPCFITSNVIISNILF